MKSHHSGDITIPDGIAARCVGPDQFNTFDRGVRTLLAVPKAAVVKSQTRTKRRKARAKKTTTA